MKKLTEMSYEEFGKLRFLDFFPKTEDYIEDHEGGLESGIGLSCFEGYSARTCFSSPENSQWNTAEMCLTFEHGECPETEGNALLSTLGLSIQKGTSHRQVKENLLKSGLTLLEEKPGTEKQAPSWLLFVCGKECPYYVSSLATPQEGIIRVWICRKDLADQFEKLQSGA
jgi:hypothetical protein